MAAFVKSKDTFYQWARTTLQAVQCPYITCEPVITETLFLLSNTYSAKETIRSLISDGVIQINFQLSNNADALSQLMTQYDSVPMSLADACLVRMVELNQDSAIITLDSDFKIYRMHRNQAIPLIMPES